MLELIVELPGAPEGCAILMERVARLACEAEGIAEADACARLMDDVAIRAINARARGIDRATDVLSFPMIRFPSGTARENARLIAREIDPETGRAYLGDIAISLTRARAQAREYGHSLARELGYLTAHAMLHLLGYDHEREGNRHAMREMEEIILARADVARGLSGNE